MLRLITVAGFLWRFPAQGGIEGLIVAIADLEALAYQDGQVGVRQFLRRGIKDLLKDGAAPSQLELTAKRLAFGILLAGLGAILRDRRRLDTLRF